MKAIASIAIAGVLAASSLATATTANAGGPYWKYPNYRHYHAYHQSSGWNAGAALATGAILGLTVGALASPPAYYYPAPAPVYYYPPPPPPAYYGATPYAQHVSWCASQYRTYNASTNTFIGYDGYAHTCVGPY